MKLNDLEQTFKIIKLAPLNPEGHAFLSVDSLSITGLW